MFDFSGIPYRREIGASDLERMRVPNRYWRVRFDEISEEEIEGTGKSAKDIVAKYISNMNDMVREGVGFVFFGDNGAGKTCCSVVLAKEFRRRGKTVLFVEASDLKRMVVERERFDEDETYWDRAKGADVLVLDDFGKGVQDSTGFGAELFDELIRARNARKLVTMITANQPVQYWKEKFGLKKSTVCTLKECMMPVEVSGRDRRDDSAERIAGMMAN